MHVLRGDIDPDKRLAIHDPATLTGFEVESSTSAGTSTVIVRGEVDCGSAPVLRDHLLDLVGLPDLPGDVVVDLRQVSFLNAAGLTALAITHQVAGRAGGRFRIRCGTARAVIRPLQITGLWNVFTMIE